MLDQLIDGLQAKYPPNRIAIALGVVVTAFLTPAAGVATAWVAVHFPSLPTFTPAEVLAAAGTVSIAVATAVITLAYKWIDGWQQREARRHDLVSTILKASSPGNVANEVSMILESLDILPPAKPKSPSIEGTGSPSIIEKAEQEAAVRAATLRKGESS